MKKALTHSLKILIAVGLLYWLWESGKLDFSALKHLLAPQWGALGIALVGLGIFLTSERWRLLLKTQKSLEISRGSTFKLTLIGMFFNYAMPGGVGGDVVKAFYFHKDHPGSKFVAVTSVAMDRIVGLFAMLLMGLAVMAYDWDHIASIPQLKSLFMGIFVITLIAAAGLFLLFSPHFQRTGLLSKLFKKIPWGDRFQKLYDSVHSYGRSPATLLKVVLYSWCSQILSILFLILVGHLSGVEAPWTVYFLVAPLGFIAMGLPISPGGIGVGQTAFYFLFNIYLGTVTSIGPTVITALQVVQLIFGLVGAYFYLRRHQPIPENIDESTLAPTETTNTEYVLSR